MTKLNRKTICPLPWLHFSAHLDSTMRLCCNTDGLGFIKDDNGNDIKLSQVESIHDYFNLPHYKNIRSKMIAGEQPNECKKCYEVEKFGGRSIRENYVKTYQDNENFEESLISTQKDGTITPKVQSLDFSLSNQCNLKCIMCAPDASYLIKKDWDKLGLEYDESFVMGAKKNWKKNPSFEKIIPQVAPSLREVLTTGGEPFLNPEHFKILKLIVESGHAENIVLTYNTNCTVENSKLFELWHHFKRVEIHFSIDAYGRLDEYIRHGTKWKDVQRITQVLLAHPKTNCEVHSTIQVLNIFNLPELYSWINKLEGINPLPFHIWMHHPAWLKINILPKSLKLIALQNLNQYFQTIDLDQEHIFERAKQITSYVKRSLEEPQDKVGLEIFKTRIKKFEKLRGTTPIEEIVPLIKKIL